MARQALPTQVPLSRRGERQSISPGRDADHVCDACGYGVPAGRVPERCPMCGGRSWRLSRQIGPAAHRRPALTERPGALLRLTDEQRQALITVLYVVRDNWWLSDVEEAILRQLELGPEGDPHEAALSRPFAA